MTAFQCLSDILSLDQEDTYIGVFLIQRQDVRRTSKCSH